MSVEGAPTHRAHAAVAMMCTAAFLATTTAVHVIELTAFRAGATRGIAWPSPLYAAELAAWDVLLGIALLFLAPVVTGSGRARWIRWGFAAAGVLCLGGIAGPLMGDMRVQRIGILGYAVVLPCVCALVALEPRSPSH
jgi:hypothetical protein